MDGLKQYLKIFGISINEFLTIAFEETEKIILITKKDMTRIKYNFKDNHRHWEIVRNYLPKELEFVGFQHSEEGNSFSAYTFFEKEK